MIKPMKRYANPRGTLLFILIAVILMFIIHLILNGGAIMPAAETEELSALDRGTTSFYTELQYPKSGSGLYTAPSLEEAEFEEVIAAYTIPEAIKVKPAPVFKSTKKAPAYQPIIAEGSPKIAIIIDDMGVDRSRSFQAIDIDAPLTLSFLPYASSLADITQKARDNGHELMIHMPMQAMTSPVSLGPIALKEGMNEEDVKANMEKAFESFEGYVGLNNHMGSKITQNGQIMDWAMESIKSRGLYFVDSKTIGSSIAAQTARLNGLPTAERDVFLDHENTSEFVISALRKTEAAAVRNGYAIAIGHPKDVTIAGLKKWIPDARSRGFEIVYASALVERPRGSIIASAKSVQKPAKLVAQTQPAAGNVKAKDDPNSPEARAKILRQLFGQITETEVNE